MKDYLKQLLPITVESEFFHEATLLLIEIYKVLCHGCGYYIFSSEDPFRSVGINQKELYGNIVQRIRFFDLGEEEYKNLIILATKVHLSTECLHVLLFDELFNYFTYDDEVRAILQISMNLLLEQENILKKIKKYDDRRYFIERFIDNLNDVIFICHLKDNILKSYIDFYVHKYNGDQEIAYYCMLELARLFGNDDQGMFIYKYGLTKHIAYRQSIKDIYQEIIKNKE